MYFASALSQVFSRAAKMEEAEAKAAAKYLGHARHLIRWCLRGDEQRRPSIKAMLAHPLLKEGAHGLLAP